MKTEIDYSRTLIEVFYEKGDQPLIVGCSGSYIDATSAEEELNKYGLGDLEDIFEQGDGTYLVELEREHGDYEYNCDGVKICIAPPCWIYNIVRFTDENND